LSDLHTAANPTWSERPGSAGRGSQGPSGRVTDYKAYPILVVDDEPENLLAFELNFRNQFTIITATSGRKGLEILAEREVALVITDQRMPEMTGVEFLDKASVVQPDVLRMILTGYSDINALIDAVNMGRIYHYVTKPWDPDELAISIKRAIDAFRLGAENRRLLGELKRKNDELEMRVRERTRELEEANEKLKQLAVTDGLTGLYNHRYFQEKLDQEVARAERFGHPVSLCVIDVDHFKAYNDAHGHPRGDEVLKRVAFLLVENVREVDTVARYGGEEFVIILPETSKENAAGVAEKIRSIIERTEFPRESTQPLGRLTVSVGVGSFPSDGKVSQDLMDRADEALFRAKAAGRNRVEQA
jgi:two-component system cell cycle response regulator